MSITKNAPKFRTQDTGKKFTDNAGKDQFVAFPAGTFHFEGKKASGLLVAVKIDRTGLCEQMGLNSDGSALFSVRPFTAKKYFLEHVGQDWMKYACEAVNVQSITICEGKDLKELRASCESAMGQTMLAAFKAESEKADGNASDLKDQFIEQAIDARSRANIDLKIARSLGKVVATKKIAVTKTAAEKAVIETAKKALADAKKAEGKAVKELGSLKLLGEKFDMKNAIEVAEKAAKDAATFTAKCQNAYDLAKA